jgi:hypothetical protein
MDGPVYFALTGLVIFGTLLFTTKNFAATFYKTALFFLFTGLTFAVCAYPFLISFKNFTGAITPVDYRSPFWMLMILWGFQFFTGLSFLIFLFFGKIAKKELLAKAIAGLFGLKLEIARSKHKTPTLPLNPLMPIDLFVIFLLFLSTCLIIFPEFFYIKDIYIHEYQRANTMFKMTYQAFILLYIAAVYIFFRILFHIKNTGRLLFPQTLFLLISLAGFISISIYPYYSVKSYYGMINYHGLDGLKYLQSLYPNDYKLINSLNSANSPIALNSQTVILEAVGDSYTKYARISANTGISTVLGWPVHEWLWRNGYDIPGKRTADVQKIYESTDLDEAKKLLKEYKVDYVWVGQLEHEKYPNLNEFKFRKIGKVTLKIGNSVLYKMN